ncbi:MAG: hypothetical protein JW807_11340 [Spirochaetes bacterium]|nr:hypothetical protein [Spirochaetota bacterium]
MKKDGTLHPPAQRAPRGSKNRPNIVHPTIPGAVGSLESPYREGRDTVAESKLIIEDTIGRISGEEQKG